MLRWKSTGVPLQIVDTLHQHAMPPMIELDSGILSFGGYLVILGQETVLNLGAISPESSASTIDC